MGGGEETKSLIHLLVHFPNICKAWVEPKPEAWNSVWVPHVSGRGLLYCIHLLQPFQAH